MPFFKVSFVLCCSMLLWSCVRQGFVSVLGCLFAMLGRNVVNYGCVSFGWIFNGVVFV